MSPRTRVYQWLVELCVGGAWSRRQAFAGEIIQRETIAPNTMVSPWASERETEPVMKGVTLWPNKSLSPGVFLPVY